MIQLNLKLVLIIIEMKQENKNEIKLKPVMAEDIYFFLANFVQKNGVTNSISKLVSRENCECVSRAS
jgi:hypothetical protein